MTYKEYEEYRCIARHKVGKAIGIGRGRTQHADFPSNLSVLEMQYLKSIIGDWDSFTIVSPHIGN